MSSPERAPRRALAMNELDPYEVLQVDPTASHEVITAAYRALARLFHPDVMPGPATPAPMGASNAARGPARGRASRVGPPPRLVDRRNRARGPGLPRVARGQA